MTTFGTNFQLSSLNGANGFQISGEAAVDRSGISVASAGDVNGDGFDDLVIGAPGADPNGSASGASYVVFGGAGGFAANLNLSTLDGSNGFQISGEAANDGSGSSVTSAGDVNGDGFDDLVIGAQGADPNGGDSGASYVVFGRAGGFAANLGLSTLDGTNGFQLNGEAAGDNSGFRVASAGDVNRDGFDDLVVGALLAGPNGGASGASYVVFGRAGGFAASLNLSTLNGSNGFQVSGEAAGDLSGASVASAGDINGDGFDDLVIGASGAPNGGASGASYVVFGRAGGFAANLNLVALDGSNGFQISGEAAGDLSGASVASAGDVNGDGFDDLVIGAAAASPNGSYSGASYVVFGRAGGFAANLNLSTLNGTNGFQISGEAAGDRSGTSVASAGDVNGDGFDDLVIGAYYVVANGADSGASYVVFGRAGGFAANLNLAALDGALGFQISGEAAADLSGQSVASAGDVNGDGFDDLVIGAHLADPNGGESGASYVVFGKATRGNAGNDVLDASDANDALAGFGGNDIIRGNGGLDTLNGGDGNDFLSGGAAADTLVGGAGNDLLDGGIAADQLYGGSGNDNYALGAEASGTDSVIDADGADTITSTINRSLAFAGFSEIENLVLFSGAVGTGNALRNTITGNAAANTLNGLTNIDRLIGGNGSDTYLVDSTIDTVVEAAGAAAGVLDHVLFAGAANQAYTLAANVERLTLAGAAASRGTGNVLANTITGNAAANTLDGFFGNDTLRGMNGNDILIGGLGKDYMTGGANNDVFRFAAKTHSLAGVNADVITDFDDSGNDRIDLSAVFGPAMSYRHNLAFTAAGQVRINDIAGADVLVEVNTGGSLAADMQIRLSGTTLASMSASDFFL